MSKACTMCGLFCTLDPTKHGHGEEQPVPIISGKPSYEGRIRFVHSAAVWSPDQQLSGRIRFVRTNNPPKIVMVSFVIVRLSNYEP